MIVATAGHVDHGKTSLVRALTGIDPDRLPEEKRRGMTIEPGFAHAELGGAEPVAFVDVPGHERFVRHMLAGVSGVDGALLVIAADDGPMPQTREHLCVLDLLGVSRGAVVLTKIDRVSPERLAEVRVQVDSLLAGTTLERAPLFPLSTVTGEGLDALRVHLAQMQRDMPAHDDNRPARYTIDRSFSRPGAGLVVTGTLLAGRVQVGDELRVSPSGSAVRVRGLQVHGRSSESAHAGQRCALNLAAAGADRLALERGDWLVAPETHAPTARLDVMLHWLASATRPLPADAMLQLHLGATERTVRVVPLSQRRWEPGQRGAAQLVLDRPVSALHGDRLVLRDTTAQQIVGSATVLDPWAMARGRSRPERLAALDALAEPDPRKAFARLLDALAGGVDWPAFARARQLSPQAWQAWPEAQGLAAVDLMSGLHLLSASRWQALQARAVAALATAHAERPDSVGLAEAPLLRAMDAAVDVGLRRAALRAQLQAGRIVRDGFVLRLPGHEPRLQPEDEALLARVIAILRPLGLRPLPPGELAPLLEMELKPLSAFLQRAAALGHLVQVAKNRFFLPATLSALVEVARQCAAAAPDARFDARSFRDASGIGRNLTIQLLEFFDRCGITRYAAERRSMAPGDDQR
jgi:selenocysteine-specific elongation factor